MPLSDHEWKHLSYRSHIRSEKVPLFFEVSQMPHHPYYGCCVLLLPLSLPGLRKKHVPGTFSSLTDSIHKFHSLILQFRCKKYSAFSLFSLRLYFDKRVLRTRSATFFCQILLFLVYFSFIFFFYTESYKSIRTIWAVSTILVPESILHF